MIKEQIKSITEALPTGVRLCAVSKFHSVENIYEAYEAGQRIFGESHVQELKEKVEYFQQQTTLPTLRDSSPIEWHFIGHLQTNKVKYIAPFVSLIHSMDSAHLFDEIAKQGLKCGRDIPCLVQLHVAQEETKYGFTPTEAVAFVKDIIREKRITGCGVSLRGIMAMASHTNDTERIRTDFRTAHDCFTEIKALLTTHTTPTIASLFSECSMGMSDDYHIAIEEGATLIRIGSTIFGERT